MLKGFVDFTKYERGFGFIYDLHKQSRYFFHVTSVEGGNLPKIGSLVEFTPGVTLKGPIAQRVRPLSVAETVETMLSLGSKS